MRKNVSSIYLLTFSLLFSLFVSAQSAAINDDGTVAHPSAILDVKVTGSVKKGVLIPRLTTTQRNSISAPAKGLLVYDSTAKVFYFHNGTAWTPLASGTNPWTVTGTNITKNVTGNVGIGAMPNVNAILDVSSTTKGVLFPRMNSSQRLAIPNTTGLLVYDLSLGGFYYNDGAGWQNLASGTNIQNLMALTDGERIIVGNTVLNHIWTGRNIIAIGNGVRQENPGGVNAIAIGQNAMLETGLDTNNIAIGGASLQLCQNCKDNVAVGHNTIGQYGTGNRNVAIGNLALQQNRGSESVAIGFSALRESPTATANTAIGFESGYNSYYSSGNTTVGHSAGRNMSGRQGGNTGVGGRALFNTSGAGNTGVGYAALQTSIGYYNTGIGTEALYNNYSTLDEPSTIGDGSYNSGLGYRALYTNRNGQFNTALGSLADVSGPALQNATAIGYSAVVNASNKVRIGNAQVTVIEGQVPFTVPSDGRYKFNVRADVKGLDFILRLKPVTYQFDVNTFEQQLQTNGVAQVKNTIQNQAAMQMRRTGFIAQEVEQAAQQTGYDFSGIIAPSNETHHYSLSYEAFVVPLVKAVQDQQAIIDKQTQYIEQLEKRLQAVEKKFASNE